MYKRGKYKFIHIDGYGNRTGMVFGDEVDLTDMCRKFTYFLRSCGFIFDHMAEVEVVYPEPEKDEEEC